MADPTPVTEPIKSEGEEKGEEKTEEGNTSATQASAATTSAAPALAPVSEPAPQATVQQPEAPDPTAHVQIDPEAEDLTFNDSDSAVASTLTAASTSLSSSVRNYVYENGRRYHSYKQGEYFFPNDDKEQDRLDLTHHMFLLLLGGRLYRAPITTQPQYALDLGTGTGIWAIEFADEFPSAQVIGTDLSPIQPQWVPPNCKFLVDDMESPWVFTNKEPFDFIHGRVLGGSIKDWTNLFKQSYEHLKPGGWVEIQEYGMGMYSDEDPELLKTPDLKYWCALLNEVGRKIGKEFEPHVKAHMEVAGLVDVHEDVYKGPCGQWPKDRKLKEYGMYEYAVLMDSIEPYTLALLTRVRKWTVEECQVLIAKVRNDLKQEKDKNFLYAKLTVTYGQRPMA